MFNLQTETQVKMGKSKTSRKSGRSDDRWVVAVSTLLISLFLWGAIIFIGKEMFRRLNAEIAEGAEAFQSAQYE